MLSIDFIRTTVSKFQNVEEEPHFEKISFRIKKKIFATYDGKKNWACLLLTDIDQHVFCSMDQHNIFPVDNKWGKQGWTFVNMNEVSADIFSDAIHSAYNKLLQLKSNKK